MSTERKKISEYIGKIYCDTLEKENNLVLFDDLIEHAAIINNGQYPEIAFDPHIEYGEICFYGIRLENDLEYNNRIIKERKAIERARQWRQKNKEQRAKIKEDVEAREIKELQKLAQKFGYKLEK